jgi:selenide,water dikinase
MEIDLVQLCAAAGARLIVGNVHGLDRAGRRLLLDDRPPLPYDLLSIGIGSVPSRAGVELDPTSIVPIKPMQTFLDRLDARLRTVGRRPLRVAVVGGGAGGVEVTCCLPPHVRAVLGDVPLELTLIDAREDVVAGMRPGTIARVRRRLERRGVTLRTGRRVVAVGDGLVGLDDGATIAADLVLWATNAAAPPILSAIGLPTDDRGFLLTEPTLQTVADPFIFAVGDTGTIRASPTPKAGVYAVRQGPILRENLGRVLDGRPPRPYVPQRGFLKLLNTGDGRAIGEFHGLSFEGRWCWRLKDRIDRRFIARFQDLPPMAMRPRSRAAVPAMRCAGCGGKVGGSVLARVLERLDNPVSPRVLVGLDAPDDATVIAPAEGRPLVVTADFFAAPLDDPYLVGRIAALHAASDVFAMGATPLAALALVTIPTGPPRTQEQCLFELLAGGLYEFRRMGTGTSLAGGHTIEGPQLTIGYTLLADHGPGPLKVKGGLRPGDRLVLTKPLGTGILLAAQMRARCRAAWMQALLRTMLLSNQEAAETLDAFDVRGLTDVTGFGLAGHLLEMLRASGLPAVLSLAAVPLLPGVAELVAQGTESTLAPANRVAESEIEAAPELRKTAAYAALFDPQTCGGLLVGVPEHQVQALLDQLGARSEVPASQIGHVLAPDDGPRLRVV